MATLESDGAAVSAPEPEKNTSFLSTLSHVLARLALVFAGVHGLAQGNEIWVRGSVFLHTEMLVASMITYLSGFVCLTWAAAYHRKTYRYVGWVITGILAFTTLARGYNQLRYVNPQYGTDAVAFNHYAAELTLKGTNPYTKSMGPAAKRFNVPKKFYTPDDEGRVVHTLSYPSLSFLLYVPFIAAGVENVNWVNLISLVVSIVLLLLLAPWWLRPLAPFVFLFEQEFVYFTVGGVTDILYVPLLLLAVYYWDRKRDLSAIMWGLACGVKQGPWFLAPFMFVAIYHENIEQGGRAVGRALARYFLVAGAALLTPNIPFAISAPVDWFSGVVTPMGQKLILYGSGLINLTTAAGIPLARTAYTLLALCVLVTLMAVYSHFYSRIRPAMWFFHGFVLWLTPRSLHSYFVYWTPVFLLAVAWAVHRRYAEKDLEPSAPPDSMREEECGDEAEGKAPQQEETMSGPEQRGSAKGIALVAYVRRLVARLNTPRGLAVLIALPFAGFTVAAVLGAASAERLRARVVKALDPHGSGVVTEVVVEVENRTSKPVVPRFVLRWRGTSLFFWDHVGGRPPPVGPGQKGRYRIRPRDHTQAPPLEDPFRVRVYDTNTSKFYLTEPSGPQARSALVYNRYLEYWDDFHHEPVAWKRSPPAAWEMARLGRRTVNGRPALCMSVDQRGVREWKNSSLTQELPSLAHVLVFDYWSEDNPVGENEPKQLLGVELEFPRGETAVINPSFQTTVPLVFRRHRFLLVHLPYSKGVWKTFQVDVADLARFFGYDSLRRYRLRLVVGRHKSLVGKATACFHRVTATRRFGPSGFAVSRMEVLSNARFTAWEKGRTRPLAWEIERPRCLPCAYRVSRDGRQGVTLEVDRPGRAKGWARLVLSQVALHRFSRLKVPLRTASPTVDLKEPKVFAGVEVRDRTMTHVWTVCTREQGRLRASRKGLRLHCVPQRSDAPYTVLEVDLRQFRAARPVVGLLLNVHHDRPGRHTAHFGPIEIEDLRDDS